MTKTFNHERSETRGALKTSGRGNCAAEGVGGALVTLSLIKLIGLMNSGSTKSRFLGVGMFLGSNGINTSIRYSHTGKRDTFFPKLDREL